MKLIPSELFLISKLTENLAPRHRKHFLSLPPSIRRDTALNVWTEYFGFKGSTYTVYDNVDQAYYWLKTFDEDITPQKAGYIQHYMRKEESAS